MGYFSYQNKLKSKSKISQETTERLVAIQRSRDFWRQSLESYEKPNHKAEADNECVNPNGEAPEKHTWYQSRTLFNKCAKIFVQKYITSRNFSCRNFLCKSGKFEEKHFVTQVNTFPCQSYRTCMLTQYNNHEWYAILTQFAEIRFLSSLWIDKFWA